MADKYLKASTVLESGRNFLAGVLFIEKGRRGGKTQAMVEELLRHVIRTAPAEDVVPVVRCGCCTKREKKEEYFWCKACGYRCNDDYWYCPAGESDG
jgi:hypothetical protein